jgi:protein-ribulosamine 3-kinase
VTTTPAHAEIGAWLGERIGRRFAAAPAEVVHGGSIHHCVRWPGSGGDAFVKLVPVDTLATFEAEVDGLEALRAARALRVPEVLAVGVAGGRAVLALEWLDLSPQLADRSSVQARLGEGLAAQHRVTGNAFGWHRDNAIGATVQPNPREDDGVRFFQRHRLGHMLELAAAQGLSSRTLERGRRLVERCPGLFEGYRPVPSLLHGDLWGGNWSAHAVTGEPVVFDPAIHYGDREADLAMTRLFGGFGHDFYAAYGAQWPLAAGAATRCTLYNLYHVLNHYVLFGGGHARQAAAMIDSLLAELG